MKYIALITILSGLGSQTAFSQDETYTVIGKIKNASVQKLLISNAMSVDPISNRFCYSDTDQTLGPQRLTYGKELTFILSHVKLEHDQTVITIVNSESTQGALVLASRATAKNGIINLGSIRLVDFYPVHGKINPLPNMPENFIQDTTLGIALRDSKNNLFFVADIDLKDRGTFDLNLPAGSYTFFFDSKDKDENYRRVIRQVEIGFQGYSFSEPIVISTPLDKMVENKATLQSVLVLMNRDDLSEPDIDNLDKVITSNETTLIYFFAGYCPPCFGDDGLKKYLDLAAQVKSLSVIGIDSDSYNMQGYPRSQEQMFLAAKTKNNWQGLYRHYYQSQSYFQIQNPNPRTFLLWQPDTFAKKLSIVGYPTALIFQEGILVKWYMGTNPKIEQTLESLIKN